jgi:hypothetical protein
MVEGGSLDMHVFAWERRDNNRGECVGAGAIMEGEF